MNDNNEKRGDNIGIGIQHHWAIRSRHYSPFSFISSAVTHPHPFIYKGLGIMMFHVEHYI